MSKLNRYINRDDRTPGFGTASPVVSTGSNTRSVSPAPAGTVTGVLSCGAGQSSATRYRCQIAVAAADTDTAVAFNRFASPASDTNRAWASVARETSLSPGRRRRFSGPRRSSSGESPSGRFLFVPRRVSGVCGPSRRRFIATEFVVNQRISE